MQQSHCLSTLRRSEKPSALAYARLGNLPTALHPLTSELCIPTRTWILPGAILLSLSSLHLRKVGSWASGLLAGCATLLVLSVGFARGKVRWLQLAAEQLVPAESCKEGVLLELSVAVKAGTGSLSWVTREEATQERHRLRRLWLLLKPDWEAELAPKHLVEDLPVVHAVVPEREVANQELVQADTQAPEVSNSGVPPAQHHLWSHEDGRSLDNVAARARDALGDAKVNDL
mmetsp:Transcript_73657/g.170827  ORF Transcript_73657/g.170827 Transcript_73657/m.170827 type:complete len:231 (-) Transcript_73657:961-1653(-)